jgi:hypothetical protein
LNIDGIGFTPRKGIDGSPDKKKNKMWIRFVDPETGNILSKEQEVPSD